MSTRTRRFALGEFWITVAAEKPPPGEAAQATVSWHPAEPWWHSYSQRYGFRLALLKALRDLRGIMGVAVVVTP